MAFLSIRHFSYTYPGAEKPALGDINLEIEQGSFVVITGEIRLWKIHPWEGFSRFPLPGRNPGLFR